MKVLVAGSMGMLGTELVRQFGSSCEVAGFDLPELDITSPALCRALVARHRPDAVVNAAALTDVDYCEEHEVEAFLINGEGVANLARASAEVGCLLVHYSTDYVFDGRKQDPYVEEDRTNPLSVYGKSKLAGEQAAQSLGEPHLILRTSWLFGANGKNFIKTVVGIARDRRALQVVRDQRGSPTYARDLAFQTRRMIEAGCRGTYHVTNSGWCSWYELAARTVEWAGIKDVVVTPVTTAEFPRPAPRPANSVLANERLAREGIPPMRPWAAAAEEYVRAHLA
jgi:dTDP-4-dehydrorhamnose reductase